MDILQLLDQARAQTDVLKHPFYERWSAGELAEGELALYAGEYRHAVVALAEASMLAAEKAGPEQRPGLVRHAEEERAHVALWDDFAGAVGAGPQRAPLAQTSSCVEAWTAGDDLLEHLAVLYTIEAGQPAISTTKLAGLTTHYGLPGGSRGLSYFDLHATLDVEHADQAGRLIATLAGERDHERLLSRAQDALHGNWRLLDGVETMRWEPALQRS